VAGVPSSSRGGGSGETPDIAAVLAAGHDADGASIQNLAAISAAEGDAQLSFSESGGLDVDTAGSDIAFDAGGGRFFAGDEVRLGGAFSGQLNLFADNSLMFVGVSAAYAGLIAETWCLWLDATNGAAKLKIQAKTADGTTVNGEIALT
jgi:hypothetical protein